MTDPTADTPGPQATPAQEAHVRALLGTLRGEDVPMPDDVVARINAAISAEQAAATIPDTPASLVDADDSTGTSAGIAASSPTHSTVSVLPTPEQRRGPSYTGLRRMLAVAAALVVVVGGIAVAKNIGFGGGSMATSAGNASKGPEAAAGGGSADYSARVSSSGTAYTAANLGERAAVLAGGRQITATDQAGPGTTPQAAAPSGAALDACVAQLTGRDGVTAVAVDSGTFDGAPAVIVVLPTEDDPASLDVWVLAGGCTGTEPDVLQFLRIPRP